MFGVWYMGMYELVWACMGMNEYEWVRWYVCHVWYVWHARPSCRHRAQVTQQICSVEKGKGRLPKFFNKVPFSLPPLSKRNRSPRPNICEYIPHTVIHGILAVSPINQFNKSVHGWEIGPLPEFVYSVWLHCVQQN